MISGYNGNDFYCDVVLQNKAELVIVYEDNFVLAFNHTKPFWKPVHIVVIPKEHISSFTDFSTKQARIINKVIFATQLIARDIEKQYGAARVLTNLGQYQDSKHFHIHISFGEMNE